MTELRQRHGKPHRDRKHLQSVAERGCMVCGADAQAHHLMRPWHGIRGTGRRAGDENAVPLCQRHHTALHMAGGEDVFFFDHMGWVSSGRDLAERLWIESPHWVPLEQGDDSNV